MSYAGKKLVPIPEARSALGEIGRSTLYELIDQGELVRVKLGRRAFVTAESLAAYVDRLTAASTAARDCDGAA
ncbi:helix-turn-helix transcriptional regulator [Mycobacterium paragordonae]|uniref:Helix-turn-helix domain-containing protein n=1 Tax=Mycobacterium paragordonae TaxID=1389713 RepID=A0AAJ1W3K4_9MYCO|nr:helix-turn-helix domain-containing protein [Mycobacterium paragordonae]MDP7735139.1 helix-turn-helix domain-containing protein [Mycobacterium paragordonae]